MGLITLRNYPNVKLEFNLPRVVKETNGFIGKDGEKVKIEKKNGKLIILTNNTSDDLKILIELVNNAGSPTAMNQIFKTSNNLSKIHVKIENKIIGYDYGYHQPYDKNNKTLEWNDTKKDFDGLPIYVEGKRGIYKEVLITVYKSVLKHYGENNNGYYDEYAEGEGIKLSLEEAMAVTFAHESAHNTDNEFIENLRNKREGKNYREIDGHKNIDPQDSIMFKEIDNSKK